MTINELKKDLISKLDDQNDYFNVKILKSDYRIFQRRSFRDLFHHYRRKGVSQKMLMQALMEAGFSSYFCFDVNLFVFFGLYDRNYKFLNESCFDYDFNYIAKRNKDKKYTFKYLESIYDSIYKK